MTSVQTLELRDKPYRGPDSYRSEDADLFFGRDLAADQVIAKLLSSRFVLLHAQSGAGKTSLLNARVLPELEARGWLPVRITPQDDPTAAVRLAIFLQLLPSPRAEAAAIARAVEALGDRREPPTINELLGRYDSLPVRDECRRRLVSPIPLSREELDALKVAGGDTLPFFCRLLRSSIDLDSYDAHLAALSGTTFLPAGELRAQDLVVALSSAPVLRSYADLFAKLAALPQDLVPFFEGWSRIWGSRLPHYSIVLVLDQFEEMFTRFTDRRRIRRATGGKSLDWSVRDSFIEQLRRLYEHRHLSENGDGTEADGSAGLLPIRYSISLRDEFVARLDPIRCFVPDLDTRAYHLQLLTAADARTAIEEPADRFGYSYETRLVDDILQKLLKEGRFVEPAHLQIVCDKLWQECGKRLADHSSDVAAPLRQVGLETYRELGSAEGILRDFISAFLSDLTRWERVEALELLEPLITRAGTRNIVEWSQLINRQFRDPARREALVLKMQARSIVRVEWRLGGRFVEITHEFLIDAIRPAIQAELRDNDETKRFLDARAMLERIVADKDHSDERLLLSPREFEIIETNENQIVWTRALTEGMLRSAVVNARDWPGDAAERLRTWADRYCNDKYETGARRVDSTPVETVPGDRSRNDTNPGVATEQTVDPTLIISEYVDSTSSRTRENAIYALGLFGTISAVERLVDLGLEAEGEARDARAKEGEGESATEEIARAEATAKVARQALLRLEGESERHAVRLLASRLDDPAYEKMAYELLGKLNTSGIDVVLPRRPFIARWRTARKTTRISRRPPSTREQRLTRWRLLEPAMIGGGGGMALIATLVAIAFRDSRVSAVEATVATLAFGLLIGGPALILPALRMSDPIQMHVDQRVAALVETARAWWSAVFPWPFGIALAFVLTAGFLGNVLTDDAKLYAIWFATSLTIAGATAAVRVGTLLAYETFTIDPLANRFWQWLTGGLFGIVAIVLGIWWIISFVPGELPREGIVKIGLFLLPTCFALSLAYARAESAVKPRRPIAGRHSMLIASSSLVAVIGVIAFAVWRSAFISTRPQLEPGLVSLDVTPIHTWRFVNLPSRVTFSLPATANRQGALGPTPTADTGTTVMGAVFGDAAPADSLGITLFDAGGKQVDYSADPPRFDLPLKAGTYAIEISSRDSMQFGAELIMRVRRSFGLEQPPKQSYEFAIRRLTPDFTTIRTAAHEAATQATRTFVTLRSAHPNWQATGFAADSAIGLLSSALEQDSLFAATSSDINQVCWWSTVAGKAEKVLPICEFGVSRDPADPMIRDSRGLARALVSDRQGAISDFKFFENKMAQSADTIHQRWGRLRTIWIGRLERGDAFDLDQVRKDIKR